MLPSPALNGLNVLEIGAGSHAAALAGVLLADNGARVIKVESPDGDRMRHSAQSAFLVLNRGKESVVADLRTAQGRRDAQLLAADADVVISAFEPGVAEEFGVGADLLRSVNPRLVYCTINGFGSSGRYSKIKAYEHVVQAKVGTFSLGTDGTFAYRPGPVFVNAPHAGNATGHLAASGILAALMVRDRTGHGQHLEVPMFMGLTSTDYFGLSLWQLSSGAVPIPSSSTATAGENKAKTVVASRYMYMPCTKDGRYVYFTALLPHQTRAVLSGLGIEDLLNDPRFVDAPKFSSAEDAQEFEDIIWETFRTRTWEDWDAQLRQNQDVSYELVRQGGEALDHPQVRHNGEVIVIDHPEHGPIEQVGPVARLSRTPARIERPAPALGNHDPIARGRVSSVGDACTSPAPEHPLSGITVIEMGYFYAMPFTATMLASMGARVIKLEDRNGDPLRLAFGAPETGTVKVTEGKESLSVDLSTPEGKAIVHKLVRDADVFLNGFRGSAAERLGMGYEALSELNPFLIYLNASGYGVDGVYAPRPMYAQCAQAMSGSIARQAGSWLDRSMATDFSVMELQALVMPRARGVIDGDSNASNANLTALLIALYHRARTGEGQVVTTSMLGGNLWAYADDAVRYRNKPELPSTDPDLNGINALYRLYESKDGWIFLAVLRDEEWSAFIQALGNEMLLSDKRFADRAAREANDEALAAMLEAVFATRPGEEWEELMVENGVACVVAPAMSMSEFASTDTALREAGLVAEIHHPHFGRMIRHGLPIRFSETPGRLAAGCLNGQNTRPILEELGYSDEEIERLEASGAVYIR